MFVMGLVTEEVQVKISTNTIKYYEDLGYEIPKRKNKKGKIAYALGEQITVNVKDLSINSKAEVHVECDGCGEDLNIKWNVYKRYVKEEGKYYCQKCAMKLYGTKRQQKSVLRNSISFYEWCIKHSRQDILDRFDFELNNCTPHDITWGSEKKLYFKCPKGIHKSEKKNICKFTSDRSVKNSVMDCVACNSFGQFGIDHFGEDFLELYWDWEKNEGIDPMIISRASSSKKVWIKCQNAEYHCSYPITCTNFSRNKARCPLCSTFHGQVHPLDSLGQLLEDKGMLHLFSENNKRSPYKYTQKSDQEVLWKCPDGIHEEFFRSISSSNGLDFRCASCSRERDESFLQQKIREYLDELGYTVLHENKCNLVPINPKTKFPLPYDNELVELKLIIETMGKQHYYEKTGKWFKENYNLHTIKVYDRYKRILAKRQGYFYLDIPYRADDKNKTWKQLIDDKINEIIKC